MARIDNNAEGGSNGTTVTTGNSGGASGTAFSAVNIAAGTTLTYTSTSPLDGLLSYSYTVSTAASAVTADLPVSAAASGSVTILARWTGLPSAEIQGPITLRGSGTTYARIQTAAAGTARCTLDSNGSLSSGTMTTGVTYRIELVWYNFGTANSILVCNVYNHLTGALVLTCSHKGTTAGNVDTVRIGKNGGTATITGLVVDRILTDTGKLNEFGSYPDSYLNAWPAAGSTMDTRLEVFCGSSDEATPIWRNIIRLDNDEAGVYGEGRSEIKITRGRQDETRPIDTSTCTFQLNNRDGRFSPRNPASPYYGYIGRNTPVRVSLPATDSYMQLDGGATAAASAPDSAALSITGDIDIRVNLDLDNWWAQRRGVLDKYLTTGNQRAYQVLIEEDGYPRLQWSTNGTNNVNVVSTVPVPFTSGRWSLRWTLDVNNGSGGYTVIFYYSADTDLTNATWTTLDTVTTTAGTTSIFDSTASVFIGDNQASDVSSEGLYDKFYSAQIRSGIAGTVVANPDFTTLTAGTAAFHDTASTPNIWTLQNTAYIEDRDYRFWGETSEWPVKWDTTGNDIWVDMEAAGLLRRLGQGSQSTGSAAYRTISNHPDMVAYWPVEDGEGATVPSSGSESGTSMRDVATVTSAFAAYSGTFKGTKPIAYINLNTWYGGVVPRYTSTGNIEVQWLMSAVAGQIPNDTIVLRLFTTGTAGRWDIVYTTAGSGALEVKAYDFEGVSILSGGATALGGGIDGKDNFYTLQLVQNGSNIDWELRSYQIDSEESWLDSGTLNSYTVGAATGVHANSEGAAGAAQVAYGQIAVFKEIVTDLDSDQAVMADAYRRETAANRIKRLCDEQDLLFRERGARANSSALGYQLEGTLLDLLQEAAETDGGWLYEDRDRLGLVYRTRASMYAALPTCELDFSLSQMQELEAVEDDSAIRNDVTVQRVGGGSYRVVEQDGRLSVSEPPTGAGRYDKTYDLSLARESQPKNQAGFRLAQGTIDEPRYKVRLNLAQSQLASATLQAQVRSIDIGHRLDILNPPDWLPRDDFRTIVQGMEEILSNFTHELLFHTQPFAPWQVGFVGDTPAFYPSGGARYSLEGTVTAEALDTTETAIDITNPTINGTSSRVYWGHGDGDYSVLIGGEEIVVGGVTGTGTSQTFTPCTRSANGVVKSHPAGTPVTLLIPARRAL